VLPEFYKHPAEFVQRMGRQYGDIAFVSVGPQNVYLLSHPDYVQDVLLNRQNLFKKSPVLERAKAMLGEGLLTSEEPFHLKQRRVIQPVFHRERLAGYGAIMAECAAQYRERWRDGQELNLTDEMAKLTLAIVARALFSSDVESEADQIGHALKASMRASELILLPYSGILEKIPILPPMRRFRKARAVLDSVIFGLIEERRSAGFRAGGLDDAKDLLTQLLAARYEDGTGMSNQQVRDEALTLFVAGHETTAVGITWGWYLLSQNPEAEACFHAELDEVLGDRVPEFADLPRLRYTEAVFAETLRLFPPVWGVGRRALTDIEIGGYQIPKGSVVAASPWAMHRDPRWFPEPEQFRPERWLEEAPSRPKFAYFPFGGGLRGCIGDRFALAEGALVMATLAQRWRFQLKPGHPVETHPMITLRARYGMQMTAHARG
jgi:cytochrome P450